MAPLARITVENLLDTYLSFPPDIREKSPTLHIGLSVVKYFLGEDWIEKHLNPLVSAPGFLRLKLGDDARSYIQTLKTVDLGELLFNLQHIEGFDGCIERMKSEENVESGIAELDFGRMLLVNRHKFRFITPQGKRGNDYDFEITLDKWTVCADVKCKLDDKDISERIILNELKNSRSQLPEDKPGVFFVKVPQHWMETPGYENITAKAAQKFLRPTGRIVSIKYYIAPYIVSDGELGQGHYFQEIHNPKNRFDARRKWELFSFFMPTKGAANAMPSTFRRFIDFPDALLKAEHEGIRVRIQ